MLKSKGLTYHYPGQGEMRFPDLLVPAKEGALLLGPSGSGKTTLLHLLAGLRNPAAGTIWIKDQELTAMSGLAQDRFRGKEIGIIFQKSFFLPYLNLEENLLLAASLQGASKAQEALDGLLAELQLIDRKKAKPSHCSVGELQRASIAQALLAQPSLVLADEPTSALDDDNAYRVARLLKRLTSEAGAALLIVTHDARLKDSFERNYRL